MNKALFATSINIIMLPIITNYVFRGEIYGIKGLEGMVFDYQFTTFVVGLPLKLINPI
jgi:RNase H-fold protein (predicted Holliday junction resolvase)